MRSRRIICAVVATGMFSMAGAGAAYAGGGGGPVVSSSDSSQVVKTVKKKPAKAKAVKAKVVKKKVAKQAKPTWGDTEKHKLKRGQSTIAGAYCETDASTATASSGAFSPKSNKLKSAPASAMGEPGFKFGKVTVAKTAKAGTHKVSYKCSNGYAATSQIQVVGNAKKKHVKATTHKKKTVKKAKMTNVAYAKGSTVKSYKQVKATPKGAVRAGGGGLGVTQVNLLP